MPILIMLTQEKLKETFNYNPETGMFTRKVKSSSGDPIGSNPGCLNHGYLKIGIAGKKYQAHQLVFLYMTGKIPNCIDHINGIRNDNRWSNLRIATHTENQWNSKINSNNTTGIKGLTKTKCGWLCQINHKGTSYTKHFRRGTKEDAIEWLKQTRILLHDEFANHG